MTSKLKMFERGAERAMNSEKRTSHPFCGRDLELQRLYKILTSSDKTVVLLHGLKQIGKSRLMLQLMKLFTKESEYLCCYHNFRRNRESFLTCLNNCLASESNTGLPDIGAIARDLGDYIDDIDKTIVFFLDDVDKDRSQSSDTTLKEFLKEVTEVTERVQFVLTSTGKMSFAGPFCETFEVGPLDDKAMTDLVFEVVKDVVDRDEEEVYVKAVARLCEGLPVAAILMGSEMHEDEGLMTPSELLELLITNRLNALSPDFFPPSDRVGEVYQESYTRLDSMFKDMFDSLSESMTGNQFQVQDAVQAVGLCDVSDGLVKKQYIQPLVKRSILTVSGSVPSSREKCLKLHNIFKDCIVAQREKSESKQKQQLKLSQESALSIGLDLPNSVLESPRNLAKFIADMRCQNDENMVDFQSNKDLSGDVRGDPMNTMLNSSVTSTCGPNALRYSPVDDSDSINCKNRLSSNGENRLSSNCDNRLSSNCDLLPPNILNHSSSIVDNTLPSEAFSCSYNGNLTNDKHDLTIKTCDCSVSPNEEGFETSHTKDKNIVAHKHEHSPAPQEHSWIETELNQLKMTDELENEHSGSDGLKRDADDVFNTLKSTAENHQPTSTNQMDTMWNISGTSMCGPKALPYTSVSNEDSMHKESRPSPACNNLVPSNCDNCQSFDLNDHPSVDFSLLSECDRKLSRKASSHDPYDSCNSNISANKHVFVDRDLKVENVEDAKQEKDKPIDCDIRDCVKPAGTDYVHEKYQISTHKKTPNTNQDNVIPTDSGDCAKQEETKYVYDGFQVSTTKKQTSDARPELDIPTDCDISDSVQPDDTKCAHAGFQLTTKKYKSKIPVRKGAKSSNRKENEVPLKSPKNSAIEHSQSNSFPSSDRSEEDSSLTERKYIFHEPRNGTENGRMPTENEDILNNLNKDDSEKCLSDKKPF